MLTGSVSVQHTQANFEGLSKTSQIIKYISIK